MAKFDPYKKPMSVEESERLLKGAADRDRSKSDWAFLGHSVTGLGALVLLVICIGLMLAGWFR